MRRRKRCSRTRACASSRRAPRWSEAFLNLGSPCGSPDGKLCRCKGERGHCAMVRGAPWRRHDRMKKRKEAPMLTLLRSDWLYSMLAGFALGTLIVVLKTPAVPDRKSVVLGKSVSVRFALGGRRIIKKTTKT